MTETRRAAVRSVLIDARSRESFSGTDIDALTDQLLAAVETRGMLEPCDVTARAEAAVDAYTLEHDQGVLGTETRDGIVRAVLLAAGVLVDEPRPFRPHSFVDMSELTGIDAAAWAEWVRRHPYDAELPVDFRRSLLETFEGRSIVLVLQARDITARTPWPLRWYTRRQQLKIERSVAIAVASVHAGQPIPPEGYVGRRAQAAARRAQRKDPTCPTP